MLSVRVLAKTPLMSSAIGILVVVGMYTYVKLSTMSLQRFDLLILSEIHGL